MKRKGLTRTAPAEYVQKGHIGKLEYECRSVYARNTRSRFTILRALLSGEEIGVGKARINRARVRNRQKTH